MSIGERLYQERVRLGLSQSAFGALVGVVKLTVSTWEKGKTAPDVSLLMKLGAAGVDVYYVLTGQRSANALSAEEAALVDNYRHSSAEGQRLLRETSAAFAQPASGQRRRRA